MVTRTGGIGIDTLFGSAGNDFLYGGDGNDLLYAGAGNDILYGGNGDDFFDDGPNNDTMYGGAGIDTLRRDYSIASGWTLSVNFITGLISAPEFPGDPDYFFGIENYTFLGSLNSIMTGNAAANTIRTGSGRDTIYGGDGNDVLRSGAGNDILYGGNGDDFFDDGANNDTMYGGAGIDSLLRDYTGASGFTLSVNFNTGLISAPEFPGDPDYIFGIENYTFLGTLNSIMTGNAADNTIRTASGRDTLFGGIGNDALYAGAGNDTLYGGAGNDVLDDGTQTDTIFGGDGIDTLSRDFSTQSGWTLEVNLTTGRMIAVEFPDGADLLNSIENFRFIGGLNARLIGNTVANDLQSDRGNDTLSGGLGHDRLSSGAGNDTLFGGDGNDLLQGGLGRDILYGDNGNDVMNGGAASDYLSGGAGSDAFVFDAALGSTNIDRIAAFTVLADTIRLDDAVFAGLARGILSAAAFTANGDGLARDASDRVIYETDTGNLYFDRDGTGVAVRVQFAVTVAGLGLTADSFVVI